MNKLYFWFEFYTMCGIVGYSIFKDAQTPPLQDNLNKALSELKLRGPDNQSSVFYDNNRVGLGHARLSILDTSDAANQPMVSTCGNFTIIFNGEVYNFKTLRSELESKGVSFKTNSDTEVLLELYKDKGRSFVTLLNGFFAFSIYNHQDKSLFIARDRMGIKPMYYSLSDECICYASELKALMCFPLERKIDFTSLQLYFQFNYIPFPNTIFEGIYKLTPGNSLFIDASGNCKEDSYYKIPSTVSNKTLSYEQAQAGLVKELEQSVQRRLVSDVPLGSFLSGGIDSSVIATLAARHKKDLNTFSIGFKDNPYFDETKYANLVAKKIGSNHTVFSLTNQDLFNDLNNILGYLDEPFADSSAIPVYLLSKYTRKEVTVSLSGDGADEMFGGYNKHFAEFRARQNSIQNKLVSLGAPLWKVLPKSRHSKFGNLFRQLDRFATGYKLEPKERYWRWCAFTPEEYPLRLIKSNLHNNQADYQAKKSTLLKHFSPQGDFNEVLYADMHQVLVNDMLTKVDSMSMANSLEVRVPFLDHEMVNYAFSLPPEFKVNSKGTKMILKDAFRDVLPAELYNRNKMGFEVPLLQWFQKDLKELIMNDLLADDFIIEQNIFNLSTIQELKNQLFSNNPGEVHAQIWALIVFQSWWKRFMQ